MNLSKEMLINEIKVLQKASLLHAKYSIKQYKNVLKALDELEKEKKALEDKVHERTVYLQREMQQKEQLANKLEKLAKYDQLTGLANRYLFLSELALLQKEALLLERPFVVLFIDLDGFKLVNDTYGHEIGDILLQTVALRIKKTVRKEDLVARLGGDEFTVILKNIEHKETIEQIAKKLIEEIKKIVVIDELDIYVGSSIGIYMYNKNDTSEDVISKADIAMYEAKRLGKGQYIFFGEDMQQELQKVTTIKNKIRVAFENKQFVNYFQPIVRSSDFTIRGVEVLLRWQENKQLIYPENFIPVLEEDIHLIREVTFWQMEEVFALAQKSGLTFSINISAKLLNDDELVEKLNELCHRYKIDTSKIFFEVTETTLSANLAQASKVLLAIKKMGFLLSLDDFGTGYSSLAYVRELPFDTIKIDKKFIDKLPKSKKDQKLLRSIIEMAKILEMKVVLEGIETQTQLNLLEPHPSIKYQGFYFYKPMGLVMLEKIIKGKSL